MLIHSILVKSSQKSPERDSAVDIRGTVRKLQHKLA